MSAVPARSFKSVNGAGGRSRFPNNSFTILAVIVVILFLSGIPQRIYYDYKAYRDEKIVDYLKISKEYTLFKHEEVSPVFESSVFPTPEQIYDLQVKQLKFKQDILRAEPPKHFERHYEVLVEITVRDESILKQLLTLENNYTNALNELIHLNNEANVRLWEELKQALTKNDIPFTELEDGWLEYEVTVSDEYERYKYEKEKNDFYERWRGEP